MRISDYGCVIRTVMHEEPFTSKHYNPSDLSEDIIAEILGPMAKEITFEYGGIFIGGIVHGGKSSPSSLIYLTGTEYRFSIIRSNDPFYKKIDGWHSKVRSITGIPEYNSEMISGNTQTSVEILRLVMEWFS